MRRDRERDDAMQTTEARTRRGAPSEDAELEWLLNKSAAEISGLGSSLGALTVMAQTGAARAGAGTRGIPRSVQGISARRASAVDRERPLRLRLAMLSPEHRQVLTLAYGERPALAVDERQRLGQWAALAPLTKAALRGWEAEHKRREAAAKGVPRKLIEVAQWRAKGLTHWLRGPAADGDALCEVREESRALVDAAWQAWTETRPPKQRRAPSWGVDAAHRERRSAEEHVSTDGDRESGVYPTHPGVPWRREVG